MSDEVDYKYALRCIYNAHSADVRVVRPTCIPDGGILTGSRDKCSKVWAEDGKSYKECQVFCGANSFIASLCVLPPSAQYPKGLFLAGSNDCSIYGFTPDSSEPVLRLLGHSGPVCTLSCGNFGYIVSGSWDKTAKVWSGQQCILTLQGHLEAVWAAVVFSSQNLILTGSADHTIRLWRSGICEKVFTGHEDCVRGLAVISDMKFLSCSNDSSVRLWLTSGECLEVFRSHSDYIYSITLLSNGSDFATCGEDQNIKIWKNGVCCQTVVISPKSLWSVACLSNGNLAVGTSDGKVYVFEKVPVDYFEKSSEMGYALPATSDASSAKNRSTADGPDMRSSIYDGEVIVIYENQNDYMYVCEYDCALGTKVKKEALDFQFIDSTFFKKPGEGASVSDPSKEKDYVFNVDVENTMYKLAFNKGENPWDVANNFVAKHNLPSDHVGQIVDYIIKNTATSFTNEFYPAKNYLTYLNVNVIGLRDKLLEFCQQMPKEKQLTKMQVEELVLLAYFPDVLSADQVSSLDKVMSWSDEHLFPVLDLLRIGVKCKGLCTKISSREFVDQLLHIFINTNSKVNIILIEKIFCNMFGIEEAEDVLTHYQVKIFNAVKDKFRTGVESIQKAGSSLLCNYAIASYNGLSINLDGYCMNVIFVLNDVTDPEAIFRVLVAVGTLCTRSTLAVTCFRSMNIQETIMKFLNRSNCTAKVRRVVEFLRSDFNCM